jgi:hypothetical protein
MFVAMELGAFTGCKLVCGIRSAKEQNVRKIHVLDPWIQTRMLGLKGLTECISRLNGRSD